MRRRPGVNGNQANTSMENAGAAYVFTQTGGAWSQQAYLKASNTRTGALFGGSVAISGDLVAVLGAVGIERRHRRQREPCEHLGGQRRSRLR